MPRAVNRVTTDMAQRRENVKLCRVSGLTENFLPVPRFPVYRGRFAPSPTGPLHFGSMVAALGSYLEARTRDGEWLLRIEDIDAPRCVPGAVDSILRTLDRYGFEWDVEQVMRQGERLDLYRQALLRLRENEWIYPCACSRREIADSRVAAKRADQPADSPGRYPGTCRDGLPFGRRPRAFRLKVTAGDICFDDLLQGRYCQDVQREVGDFILLRADGLFAYQLAVVVDDAEQGVTHVVRGADLIDSTPRQIYLQRLLQLPTPVYLHLPVAANVAGEKLSKQTQALSLEDVSPAAVLTAALAFLGQRPPANLAATSAAEVWRWAMVNWTAERVPWARSLPAPPGFGT